MTATAFLATVCFLFFNFHYAHASYVGDSIVNGILIGLLKLMGLLISLSATLFEWIIVPDNMTAIINNPAIYAIWALVRDTLNIAFIMMLLFSAFCTVFQISKYNYKNVLLNLLLMALLVNFSFPIARVIIDFSNVLMYYFLNQLGGPGSFASIAKTGELAGILKPTDPTTPLLIAAIIFSFIFAITLMAIAVLLIIRTVALAILVIFSPLAFVGTIVPGLSSHASKWWSQLFNQCFFGPVMIFMIYIATEMMGLLRKSPQFNSLKSTAGNQAIPGFQDFIVSASFLLIPIIILWLGIGMAQSMSAVGAGAVMGKAKKWGASLAKAPGKGAWWGVKKGASATGIPGGAKQSWETFKKTGRLFGKKSRFYGGSDSREAREERRAGIISEGLGGREATKKTQERKGIQKMMKDWDERGGKSPKELEEIIKNSKKSKPERLAAALKLADKSEVKDYDTYKISRELMGDDERYVNNFNEGVNKNRLDLSLRHKVEMEGKTTQEVVGGLKAQDYSKIDIEALFKNRAFVGVVGENINRKTSREKVQIATNMNENNITALNNEGIDIRRTART